MKINDVEQLLLKNGFIRKDYSRYNPKSGDWCGKVREDYEVSYGHSEIRTYERNNELINVQYQNSEVWSFIFDELPLTFESNSISAKKTLNSYNGFETLEDVILLCKFARNILLKYFFISINLRIFVI